MPRVLIAEGEPLIASFIDRGLRANGYATRVAHDPEEAAELARTEDFDILIVDERLAGFDRDELAGPATLLLLPGKDTEAAIMGMRGVQQRLTKPFRFAELLEQVRRLLRSEGIPEPAVLRAGDATLDLLACRLSVRGQSFVLPRNEFAIAELLFRNAGRDLGANEVLARARGSALDGPSAEDFRRLREKLGGELLTTVGLVGYRLRGNGEG